jgi:tight adherence protein B
VAVTIANDAATAATVDYTAPALPTKPTRPFYTSFRDKFWRSSGSTVLLGAVAAALMGLAVALLFRGRPKALRARLSEFVSITDLNDKAREGSSLLVSDRAERVLEKTRWWGRFKNDVELAELSMTPVQIVLWTLIATLMCAWLLALIVGTPGAAVLGLLIPFVVRFSILRRVRKKRDAFAEQLPDNLQVLASALRAGHSLVGALAVVVDDAEEPTRSEFRRVIADERLGVPLENALDVVVVRMASRELAQVSLVASLQRRTGSNSAEVLDRVVETIRERAEMRRLVKTLTAQGRASRWIVTALPIFLLVVISAINPHYVAPLFATSGGRIALTVATVMIIAGSYAISRIVDIKV